MALPNVPLPNVPLPALLARLVGEEAYQNRIADGLMTAWESADVREVELKDLRAVVFSDHHRGHGDGADDFRRCEAAYCAALGWYLEEGFELWLLGDVEELWENRPAQVIGHYCNVLKLERAFRRRLWRFYGNHDMAWQHKHNVERFLAPYLPPPKDRHPFPASEVREALRVRVTESGKTLGTLFLVHGHQGTIDSGNLLFVPFSRFAVRTVWGTLQRARGFANTSPAVDNVLRGKHDRAMAAWADTKAPEPLVLVTGHTHHPVYPGTFPPDFKARKTEAENAYRLALAKGKRLARRRAERELAAARALREERYDVPPLERPSYFNTGCCSFGDGDVTGLEFFEGKVRLVRWLEDRGNAIQQPLEKPKDLRQVFAAVQAYADAQAQSP